MFSITLCNFTNQIRFTYHYVLLPNHLLKIKNVAHLPEADRVTQLWSA